MTVRLSIALALAAALAVRGAGPFPADDAGIAATSNVFRAWISRVVAFDQPSGSGGLAKDDDFQSTTPSLAVSGRPADFDSGSSPSPLAHVLSLGNGGSVVVTFDEPIGDGPGPDLAVFENGFIDTQPTDGTSRAGDTNRYLFAELAYVEVATTTNAWARFPCQSLTSNEVFAYSIPWQERFGSLDATCVDGLAGKHLIDCGTPFDLAVLRTHTNVVNGSVDLSNVLYVRLVDVVGDGSNLDSSNRPILDPCRDPNTLGPFGPFATDGFDLRAIGVINSGRVQVQPLGGLRWFGVAGQHYRVQHAALPAGPWSDVGTVQTGAMAWISFTNVAPGFFRLNRWAAP